MTTETKYPAFIALKSWVAANNPDNFHSLPHGADTRTLLTEFTQLQAELAIQDEANDILTRLLKEAKEALAAMTQAKQDYERALEFYAKAYKVSVTYSNYPDSRSYDEFEDNGETARKALNKHKEKTDE